jgi:hypothetical protein
LHYNLVTTNLSNKFAKYLSNPYYELAMSVKFPTFNTDGGSNDKKTN